MARRRARRVAPQVPARVRRRRAPARATASRAGLPRSASTSALARALDAGGRGRRRARRSTNFATLARDQSRGARRSLRVRLRAVRSPARRAATGATARAPALLTDAQDALDEALARLDERARQIAPGGWPEVQHAPRGRAPDPATTICRRTSASGTPAASARSARDLVTWPDAPIRYVPIPVHTRDAAPFLYYLHYRSPAPFDRLPMHDYVVTPIEAGHAGGRAARGGCAPPTPA